MTSCLRSMYLYPFLVAFSRYGELFAENCNFILSPPVWSDSHYTKAVAIFAIRKLESAKATTQR